MQAPDPFVAAMHKSIGAFMRLSMRGYMVYVKQTGLSMSQLGALFFLSKHSGGVSDLGDEMGVTSAAASQMLDRLVHQGLIVRSEDPHDRRAKHIELTEKAQRILQEGFTARQAWLDSLSQVMSDAEKKQVMAALSILTERARELDRPPQSKS